MADSSWLDQGLWIVTADHPRHRDYLLGNPHTFHGLILAYCPEADAQFSLYKDEIVDMSESAAAWIRGFLSGTELSPPDDDGVSPEAWDAAMDEWGQRARVYVETGRWPTGNESETAKERGSRELFRQAVNEFGQLVSVDGSAEFPVGHDRFDECVFAFERGKLVVSAEPSDDTIRLGRRACGAGRRHRSLGRRAVAFHDWVWRAVGVVVGEPAGLPRWISD